jgi:SAM-dependent MidA family methyltransferase
MPLDPSLPAPGDEALAASRALSGRIAQAIRDAGGWLSFERYMRMALYEPGLGYYAGGSAKLGPAGDFVTAPELGGLFARTLARQIGALLAPGDAILELGAGSGALAEGLLDALAAEGLAPRYAILDTSGELRARQQARLGSGVEWLDALPRGFRGVIVANEVADALPVHALAWTAGAILERSVSVSNGRFAWSDRPATGVLLERASALGLEAPAAGRYESELCLAAPAWIASLADSLARGVILIVDYGFPRREYYHPQRSGGTLMCHYRHRAHDDPFFLPGLQDITAHVDFTALALAAQRAGLEVLGYATQAQFLTNAGILEVLGETDPADVRRYAPLAGQAQRLLSPAEMGELFKVLALGRGVAGPLAGFARGDRRHAL